jgi:hypothetical protein
MGAATRRLVGLVRRPFSMIRGRCSALTFSTNAVIVPSGVTVMNHGWYAGAKSAIDEVK